MRPLIENSIAVLTPYLAKNHLEELRRPPFGQVGPTCTWIIKNQCLTLVLLDCFNCIFRHLKLELLTQFPASNDENYYYL